MKKWYILAKKADFNQIGEEFRVDPVIARLIRNRNVISRDEIQEYLGCGEKYLHSPALMYGMEEGTRLLSAKIKQHSRIRIIGDYDIDGICATFILFKSISNLGGEVDYDIPDRILDGYGINENLIKKAYDDGIDTIITCDNGISAIEQIKYAKSLGMTVIVTDHHEVPYEELELGQREEILPPADVVINPHQKKCQYPFKGLCGAVVAYKFAWHMYVLHNRNLKDIYELIDIAAIATIGDVMELKGENRNIVKMGLQKIKTTNNIGLKTLIEVNGLDANDINAFDIGFVIGPCINAGGRLDTAKKALRLLLSEDYSSARCMANELFDLNSKRKDMTLEGVEAAEKIIEEQGLYKDKILVVYIPDCHESLLGIIAGRIREKYYKPVFILSDGEDAVKGSARSIEGYHMFDEMNKVKDLFIKFGGHAMAAGLSIEKDKIPEMRKQLNDNTSLSESDLTEKLYIDVAMPISYVTEGLIEQLKVLEPFGNGNTKPVFAQKDVYILEARIIGRKQNVLKLKMMDSTNQVKEGICFNTMIEEFRTLIRERFGEDEEIKLFSERSNKVKINIAYYPNINEYNGYRNLQFNLIDFC